MDRRQILIDAWNAGVVAVEPRRSVRSAIAVDGGTVRCGRTVVGRPARISVAAFGKASVAMAAGLSQAIGSLPSDGVIVAPRPSDGPWRVVVGGHPVPTEGSVRGGEAILSLARSTGPDHLLVCLVSGGGSALVEVSAGELTLADLVATNELLLRAGADIVQVNTVRKHLSAIKGGRLAEAAAHTTLLTLILSDVVGDPLDVIASGPTVPDPTTYADALAVVERFDLARRLPSPVLDHLRAGVAGALPETPKTAHPHQHLHLVGNGAKAARAAAEAVTRAGPSARVVTTTLTGEAREAGPAAATAAVDGDVGVYAGETTVTVRGNGRGGRNQEAALAAALAIAGTDAVFLAAGTDGIDGPTDAAGAVVDGGTIARGEAAGLDAAAHLERNDSYRYLAATGDLLFTGPTGTNVADLWLAWPPSGV